MGDHGLRHPLTSRFECRAMIAGAGYLRLVAIATPSTTAPDDPAFRGTVIADGSVPDTGATASMLQSICSGPAPIGTGPQVRNAAVAASSAPAQTQLRRARGDMSRSRASTLALGLVIVVLTPLLPSCPPGTVALAARHGHTPRGRGSSPGPAPARRSPLGPMA